jgi:protein SCO1/2
MPRFPVLACALAAVLAAGCGASSSGDGFRGDVLPSAIPLPNATLTADDGKPQSLTALAQDHLLVVYFGYTHCPDVCPTTMADLAAAVRGANANVQKAVRIAFVTSDPDRDDPATLHTWLSNFATAPAAPFVGLTGSIGAIDATAKSVGVPLEPPEKQADGTWAVAHGAQVLAFVHGKADHLWLAGTSIADYRHDLTQLVAGGVT